MRVVSSERIFGFCSAQVEEMEEKKNSGSSHGGGGITYMDDKDVAQRWRSRGGKRKEEDREVKERTAGTRQEESRKGSGGHGVESEPL